jgi:hypothetical protein
VILPTVTFRFEGYNASTYNVDSVELSETLRCNNVPNEVNLEFTTVGANVVVDNTDTLLIAKSDNALIEPIVNKLPLNPIVFDIYLY